MSIIVNNKTRLVVQGITGSEGSFHTEQMIAYGTKVVAGVTPGKGGTEYLGVPVFNAVEHAVKNTKANTSIIFVPPAFAADPNTDGIIMIGEIGGSAEEEAATYIKKNVKKPVVGFIAGRTAPPGRRMGHAGAIISGGKGTAAEKMAAMKKAGIKVVESPAEIGSSMKKAIEAKAKMSKVKKQKSKNKIKT